jgi:hypothetical protein
VCVSGQVHVLCSDIYTSMSTLKHSTLSALTKFADFQISVSFQIQYSVVHLTEIDRDCYGICMEHSQNGLWVLPFCRLHGSIKERSVD